MSQSRARNRCFAGTTELCGPFGRLEDCFDEAVRPTPGGQPNLSAKTGSTETVRELLEWAFFQWSSKLPFYEVHSESGAVEGISFHTLHHYIEPNVFLLLNRLQSSARAAEANRLERLYGRIEALAHDIDAFCELPGFEPGVEPGLVVFEYNNAVWGKELHHFSDTVASLGRVACDAEKSATAQILSELNKKEVDILKALHNAGYALTQSEIADKAECSEKTVSRRLQNRFRLLGLTRQAVGGGEGLTDLGRTVAEAASPTSPTQ